MDSVIKEAHRDGHTFSSAFTLLFRNGSRANLKKEANEFAYLLTHPLLIDEITNLLNCDLFFNTLCSEDQLEREFVEKALRVIFQIDVTLDNLEFIESLVRFIQGYLVNPHNATVIDIPEIVHLAYRNRRSFVLSRCGFSFCRWINAISTLFYHLQEDCIDMTTPIWENLTVEEQIDCARVHQLLWYDKSW